MSLVIKVVANQNQIPDFNFLEATIKEGDTFGYINDEDCLIHVFTMDHGELILNSYPEDIGVATLIDNICDDIIDNSGSVDNIGFDYDTDIDLGMDS